MALIYVNTNCFYLVMFKMPLSSVFTAKHMSDDSEFSGRNYAISSDIMNRCIVVREQAYQMFAHFFKHFLFKKL